MQWLELPNMGIRRIENLDACTNIRTLTLCCNQCMVDAILENTKADGDALKSPERRRWCEGFDWKPESTATEVDEALRGDTESLRDLLKGCAMLNRQAVAVLREV
ncbi:unnamed protein product [Sphacelaria rigidula]